MLEVKEINDYISYILPSRDPCSANVVFIRGQEYLWIYDVGRNPENIPYLNGIEGKKNVIISHFHGDHTEILPQIICDNIYQSRYSFEHNNLGSVISGEKTFEDGVKLTLKPFPTGHAKGCIALEVNEKYLFLGDGTYPQRKDPIRFYNVSMLKQQIDFLKSQQAEYFLLSHHEPFLQEKNDFISKLERVYMRREKNNPIITVPL